MKIVIANSIGIDRNGYYIIHSPSRWSEGVKSKHHWFAYYPWELAYLSSLLKLRTKHTIKFLDGCLLKLKIDPYYKIIVKEKPDFLVMESATRMINENLELALAVKKALGTKLVFVGPHASAFPEQLQRLGVDYVCIGEYEYTVWELVEGKNPHEILGLYPNPRRALFDINDLPWPEDDDVNRLDYGCPGEPSSEYLEIQMYASRGCMMSCNFCVARHIYYSEPNWRCRQIDNIINEIKYLKNRYPLTEGIFFDEEAHNAKKEFIIELCRALLAEGLNNLHYEAMCDVRFLDEEVMQVMKKAGYYKIRIGIETASKKVMNEINKNIDLTFIRQQLDMAKKNAIKTYGTFIFGALGSDKSEDQKTILLIKDLIVNNLLDNLQISICTPQPGTPFYYVVEKNNFLCKDLPFNRYDGGNFSLVNYPGYCAGMIESMQKKAVWTRDHFFLKSKIKNGLWAWIRFIYKRYGIGGLCLKFVRRLIVELKYWVQR